MFYVDFDSAIREVLASSGRVSFKRRYRIDVENYSWVSDYVRDQKLRKEIDELRAKITTTQHSPIDKAELRARFERGVDQIKQDFLEVVRDHLVKAQNRECPVIGGLYPFGNYPIELPLMALTMISSEERNNLIDVLPEGVKAEDINKEVEALKGQITKCEEVINTELSPPDRWIYSDMGQPWPYPQGCRWSKFVEGWKKVVPRFDGKVDIEGCALKTEAEFKAFYALELERIPKMTPLRTPWEC